MATDVNVSQRPEILALPATLTVATAGEYIQNRHLSILCTWTTGATGTFSLQCSYDDGATWYAVPGAAAEFTANSQAQPANSASQGIWNFSNVPGGKWRLLYTATSGTGTAYVRRAWTD